MKALIDPTGRVAQLAAAEFPVAPPLRWVDAPDGVTDRHTWDGERFVPPPAAPPESDPAADRLETLVDKLVDRGVLTPADRTEITPGRAVR